MGYMGYRIARGAIKGLGNAHKRDRADRRHNPQPRPFTLAQWAILAVLFVVIAYALGLLITWANARYGF